MLNNISSEKKILEKETPYNITSLQQLGAVINNIIFFASMAEEKYVARTGTK